MPMGGRLATEELLAVGAQRRQRSSGGRAGTTDGSGQPIAAPGWTGPGPSTLRVTVRIPPDGLAGPNWCKDRDHDACRPIHPSTRPATPGCPAPTERARPTGGRTRSWRRRSPRSRSSPARPAGTPRRKCSRWSATAQHLVAAEPGLAGTARRAPTRRSHRTSSPTASCPTRSPRSPGRTRWPAACWSRRSWCCRPRSVAELSGRPGRPRPARPPSTRTATEARLVAGVLRGVRGGACLLRLRGDDDATPLRGADLAPNLLTALRMTFED